MPLPNLPDFFNRLPSFGAGLRDHRTLRGLSVEELATMVAIAPSALRDIEQGKRSAPPKDVVKALADALQLRKEEREDFFQMAELGSPVVRSLFGNEPKAATVPPLTAAILVFLIADIRGYTRFTQEHGDMAAARLTTRFADVAQGVVEQWDGRLVEVRGDEILAVFASARQALRAAQRLHERCAEESQAHPDLAFAVGIGLDVGEAAQVDGGYRGAALNRAARLCSLAAPGETLIATGLAYVAPQVEGMTFVARGQEQLKGIEGPTMVLRAAPSAIIDANALGAPQDDGL